MKLNDPIDQDVIDTIRAVVEGKELPRQLKDPKKEMLVADKKGKVKTIDKDEWESYKKKGYTMAEELKPDDQKPEKKKKEDGDSGNDDSDKDYAEKDGEDKDDDSDDGEGLDKVGDEDSDVDNDGDSDDSDEYLKNRRKKVAKKIKEAYNPRDKSPRGSAKTTKDNPIILTYEYSGGTKDKDDGISGLSGNLNLSTYMNIVGIDNKWRKELLKLISSGKKVQVPDKMLIGSKQEYDKEGKTAPVLKIQYNKKGTEQDMKKNS